MQYDSSEIKITFYQEENLEGKMHLFKPEHMHARNRYTCLKEPFSHGKCANLELLDIKLVYRLIEMALQPSLLHRH